MVVPVVAVVVVAVVVVVVVAVGVVAVVAVDAVLVGVVVAVVAGEVVVVVLGVVVTPVDVVVAAGVVAAGRASRPLSVSSPSIFAWTAATEAATAAGVAVAPSAGSASSCSSAARVVREQFGGRVYTVTTIWSAIAAVTQEGQLPFSAPAALIGTMRLLCPTTRTTWNDTAIVVQAVQLAKANALFVFVTGAPSRTVTSA